MPDVPDLEPGDPIPASWLNAVKNMAKRARTIVSPGSGLFSRQTDDGNVIGFIAPPTCFYMLITSDVQAATTAGPGLGRGKFVGLRYEADDSAKWEDPADDAAEQPVYSMDAGGTTGTGKRVIVAMIGDRAHIIVELC